METKQMNEEREVKKDEIIVALNEISDRISQVKDSIWQAKMLARELGGEYERVIGGQLEGYTEGSMDEEQNRVDRFCRDVEEYDDEEGGMM